MTNNQAPRDTNNVPSQLGYDSSGHQVAALQVTGVATDATTGTVYGTVQVAGTVTATNPSVGVDGSAIPLSSTLVGASDGTNLQQLLVESPTNRNLRTGIYSGANEATVTGANALKVDGSAVTQPVSQATAASLNATATIQAVTGTSLATGSNALPVLSSAATGYVAAYGSNAAALTANTDYLFKWGAGGTTQVNHIMLQNNSTINLNWDLDVATSVGSPVLAPGQTLFLDVQTTVVHLQANGTPNVNGTSAANIVVRGWL